MMVDLKDEILQELTSVETTAEKSVAVDVKKDDCSEGEEVPAILYVALALTFVGCLGIAKKMNDTKQVLSKRQSQVKALKEKAVKDQRDSTLKAMIAKP